jgi:hypothetical protein
MVGDYTGLHLRLLVHEMPWKLFSIPINAKCQPLYEQLVGKEDTHNSYFVTSGEA